jgi:hypothetical protein
LYDDTGAKPKTAACTLTSFLYDSQDKLVYRGQLDDSRRNSLSGSDLRGAIDSVVYNRTLNRAETEHWM